MESHRFSLKMYHDEKGRTLARPQLLARGVDHAADEDEAHDRLAHLDVLCLLHRRDQLVEPDRRAGNSVCEGLFRYV